MEAFLPSTPDPQRWQLASAGLELVGVVALLAWCGYWLDGRLGTKPWALIVGAGIGIVGGLYRLVRMAFREQNRGP